MTPDAGPRSSGPEGADGGRRVGAASQAESLTLNRRSFLKALGISGVVSLTGCERLPIREALPYLIPPEEITPGTFVYYASTCAGCAAGCGLKIATRDGRPIKLEGLPEHPLSQGGLCATGQAEVRGLYDAGRLRSPTLNGSATPWAKVDEHVRARLPDAQARGVYVVARTIVSPTARQTIEAFLAPYDGMLLEYDAPADSAASILAAYERLDGLGVLPSLVIERADLLVVLGADLLGAGADPVAHTAQYAARRRRRKDRDFRHVQIEGSLTLTGAAADERKQATTGERELIALWLLKRVSERIDNDAATRARGVLGALPGLAAHDAWAADLASQLVRNRGRALVVSGGDSRAEQVAVALLNRVLEGEGHTLDLALPSLTRRGTDAALEKLAVALGGDAGAVFFLGCNPIEELPGGERLAEQVAALPLTVAITERPTATARACQVVAAAHHALECWGDVAPRGDVLTLEQPTIRPLFETRHPIENFLHWGGGAPTDYRTHLMASWRERVFPGASGQRFEELWAGALARGGVSAERARASRWEGGTRDAWPRPGAQSEVRAALAVGPAPSDASLEVELIAEVGLRDGRNTFNPWLRELSDPLTRMAWVGAARVAPALARSLQVEDGDVLAVEVGENEIQLPVRILPGQHPGVLGVPVGYGLVDGDAGPPARNGYQLARLENGSLRTRGLVATAKKTGRIERLPIVQPHPDTNGRPIVAQVSELGEAVDIGHHGKVHSLWEKRHYQSHWQMVIDLDACTGCGACVVACQAENNVPVVGPEEVARHHEMSWIRIDRYFVGDADAPDVLFEPMLCAQCDNAPCETVCPVAATVHGQEGLNHQAYNRCVGTRYCANNCPYKVRRFNWLDYTPKDPLERMVLNPDVVVRERGVMEKCTFCIQRIQRTRIDAKGHGEAAPPAVETACQQSCPARAISFGDGLAPDSTVAALKAEPRAFQVLADLGVEPSITYLARVRRRDGKGRG
jgi:molybdopterin-containing oxidoreductase family iron-sulfur binding subunit